MMNYTNPYERWNMCCSNYGMDFTQEGLNKALCLIKDAVQGERNDELEYEYLICLAPTREEKEIITSIRREIIENGIKKYINAILGKQLKAQMENNLRNQNPI